MSAAPTRNANGLVPPPVVPGSRTGPAEWSLGGNGRDDTGTAGREAVVESCRDDVTVVRSVLLVVPGSAGGAVVVVWPPAVSVVVVV
jgi:hypothetical protein